jgi:hypothetical protein
MIIDGQCSEGDNFKFKVTAQTKKFIISFIGLYPHSIRSKFLFYSFLETLGMKKIIGNSFDETLKSCNFSLDGDVGYQCYNCFDEVTRDIGIVLQKTFDTEDDAKEWFKEKIKNSEDIIEEDIYKTLIIDADKFINHINILTDVNNKIISIREEYNDSIINLKKELLLSFDSNKDIVERLIEDALKD